MKKVVALFMATLVWYSNGISAAEEPSRVLFNNVNVFDGKSNKLLPKMNVLVEGNVIAGISQAKIPAQGAQVIDGDGRTLMPGLIDNHVHLMLNGGGLLDIEANQTWEDIAIGGVAMAKLYLEEGFTTVRDMGGANAGLNRAISKGLIVGPRIYPSGAFIGGRADRQRLPELCGSPFLQQESNYAGPGSRCENHRARLHV
jgi:imidazolonepropionase-like amidohydrolase